MYEDIKKYVEKFFIDGDRFATDSHPRFPFRDRYKHILRVYKWALRINEREKGDRDVVAISALFHDVGKSRKDKRPHALVSADICAAYLEERGYSKSKSKKIIHAVKVHSSKNNPDLKLSLEDKILMDADLLDEAGAISVIWDSMAVAFEPEPTYEKVYERHKIYFEELADSIKYLKTRYGKKLYKERIDFVEQFMKNLAYELGFD